ncbi:2-isopropylmalate synthase [Sorangium sp. So ce269]
MHHHISTSRPPKLLDETLRDGIQSASVRDPRIEDKRRMLDLFEQIGIEHVTLGLPAAGPDAMRHCTALARSIADQHLRIQAACAARTRIDDIRPIVDISQQVGVPIEVMAFLGSSPIRLYAEGWDLAQLHEMSRSAISFAVKNGLPCTFVTEDTTRSHPEVLSALLRDAIDHGATRICLCDTVGHAVPEGVRSLIGFVRGLIEGMGLAGRIGIDWHGHNDRGLAVSNTLHALEAGADRLHGTVLGIGERVGNAALEMLLLNLRDRGRLGRRDLGALAQLVSLTASSTGAPLPASYLALFGEDMDAPGDAAQDAFVSASSEAAARLHGARRSSQQDSTLHAL